MYLNKILYPQYNLLFLFKVYYLYISNSQAFNMKLFFSTILVFFYLGIINAQEIYSDEQLVQFSGMVLDGTTEQLLPLPYTNIYIKESNRGTYSDFKGFFSMVAKKGDIVEFSAVGYKTVQFVIPDSLEDNRFSMVQLMTMDTINLPEAVVFPWPSRDHTRLDFLAMDITPELQAKAMENLMSEKILSMTNQLPMDANENADYYLRKQATDFYYIGQTPPMQIFSPLAWKNFFDAWKRGDFKKQQ